MKSQDSQKIKLLLHGIDTVQCAYYLEIRKNGGPYIDYDLLARQKESIRQSKKKDPMPIALGNSEFLLHPYGSSSGYPIVISNNDFKIETGEFNRPNFFVTFTSEALWRESAYILHEKFLSWADSVGYEPPISESLTRVDFSFDYKLPEIDFDEDYFVSYSKKDSKHRECGTVQTFTLGKDDIILRVYNKIAEIQQQSDKVWFFALWGEDSNVWRIEWQIRKPILKIFGIGSFEELFQKQGTLLHYLAYEHDTLRKPNDDSNRSRWPLHSLWKDLQEKIENIYNLPVHVGIGREAVLNERMMQIAISVYGYLKRVAAISCIQKNKESMSLDDSIIHIVEIINKIYEPLAWRMDVEKRRKEMLLGKW
ncbi:MAG: hypothetical protein AB2L22_17045 [Syntrophales bacterium]